MGRKPKDVPKEDQDEMCRMREEQGLGPNVIARHFQGKYHPSHITRLLAKCHQLINPVAGRDAVAKTIAPLPDTALVNVQPGRKRNAVQAIKSQSTLSAVEKSAFGANQVNQSRTKLTDYTFPAPETIDENDDSDDDDYENDGYPSSYSDASAPPTIVSLTSRPIDIAQAYRNVVNETINSGIIGTMGQYRDNLSKMLFPNLYPTQTNDGNRLSESDKEVIRKAEDLLKRNEEEEKSHAHEGTKTAVDVEESAHFCPCSSEPGELDSRVNSNETIQVMNSETESSNIQHAVTDHELKTSGNENASTQESGASDILNGGRNTSVTDYSKSEGKEVGVENSSTPPITVNKLSPPSMTETRQPAIVDDVTKSQLVGSQSAEVHNEQKTPIPQVNPSPNVNKQEILGAPKTEAPNGHESSGQSADTIGINSINTPGKCQLNINAPIVDQNDEKPATPSKPADAKVNDPVVLSTYPSKVENHFVPLKSGEIAAQTESTTNDSEWPWWAPLAIGVAGAVAVIGYDLYCKYRSRQ